MKTRTLWKVFGVVFGAFFANLIVGFFTVVIVFAVPNATGESTLIPSVIIGVFLLAWSWFFRLCSKSGAASERRSQADPVRGTRWERRFLWAGIFFCIGLFVFAFALGYYAEDQDMRASAQSAMIDSIAR